jgi:MFS family permease
VVLVKDLFRANSQPKQYPKIMLTIFSKSTGLQFLTPDGWLLFLTRFTRLFAYGSLSLVLVFYLTGLGLSESETGMLFTLILIGDTVVSLYLTTRADRIGRKRMLIIGAILMAAAGLTFACTSNLLFLIVAGTVGVISPSGNEVGPFLSIEQAALSHIVPDRLRTEIFAWYTLAGSLATAIGSLFGGILTNTLQRTAMTPVGSYRVIVILYAAFGLSWPSFSRLSPLRKLVCLRRTHRRQRYESFLGIAADSRKVVFKLSGLFAPDAFGWLYCASFCGLLVLLSLWCEPWNSA